MRKVQAVSTSDIDLATCSPWDEIQYNVRTESQLEELSGLTIFDSNLGQERAPVTPEVINRFPVGNRIKRLFKCKTDETEI